MAKKKKTQKQSAARTPKVNFDPENSRYFTPIAFGVILIGIIILFKDFIFSNYVILSGDMLNAGVFFRSFYVNYVLEYGKMPMWNPYVFGGLPFVDAFHGDILYPLSSLKFFGSLFRMLTYNLIVHIFFSGVFMYLCARQFKLSKMASVMSGVSYMFAGYIVSLVSPWHDGKIFVTALFPLTILFVERGFKSRPFLNFSALGLIIGLIILTPHAQMAYFTLWSIALYTIFKLILLFREKKAIGALVKPGLLTTYAVLIGLLISAIQFYPGYIYTQDFSPRSDSKRGWEWATSWSLHEEEAFSLLIPEFVGTNTQNAKTYYWGKNAFKDNSETVGIVALFIALFGVFFSRRKESYFFGGLALLALIYGLGATTPIFRVFFHIIPMVKSLRAASMVMFVFSFSIALLAGMGLQYILDKSRAASGSLSKKFKYALFGLPVFMFLLAFLFSASGKGMLDLWTSIFYSEAPLMEIQPGVTKMTVAYANLPAIQSGAWFGFLFTAIAAACVWAYQSGKAGVYVLMIVLLIPMINGIRFNQRFISVSDPTPYLSENTLTRFFDNDTTKYRVMNLSQSTYNNLATHGVELVVGYHGNQLKWYDKLLGGPALKNQVNPRLLNLAGAKYLIFPQNQAMPENYMGDKPLTTALNFGRGTIAKNDNSFPRVYLVDEYKVYDSLDLIYNDVLFGTDDLREIVYLEKDPNINLTSDSSVTDSAWVLDYQLDSILIGLDCETDKILVMTDNYYDAWHAYIDGNPAEIYRAYGSFRAVVVPAGSSNVLFKYESSRYSTGKLVTLLTMLYLSLIFGFYLVKPRLRINANK